MEAEGIATQEPEESRSRSTLKRVAAVAAVLLAVFVAIVLLDLWIDRSDAQRSFVLNNVECLRCHTEMLDRLDDLSVHHPFLNAHCTSCHSVHARMRTDTTRAGDYSAWRWLQTTLDRIALGLVWRVFSGSALVAESGTQQSGSTETTQAGVGGGLRTSEEEVCWSCHGDLGAQLFAGHVHEPFADGRCTSCHDPHSGHVATLLRGETEDLCVSCHPIFDDLLATQVHLPFGERRCLSCHRPHSSEHEGILTATQRVLCLDCHQDIAELDGEPVQHEPFEVACTGCHRPHVADFRPLLTSVTPDLCYGCHEDVRPQFSRVSAHPVPGRLDCPDCHLPHASGFRGLLPVAERRLCIGCHDSVRDDLSLPVLHEPLAEDPCTSCHVPHGSNARPLLQAASPELCYRCHPDKPPQTLPARTVKANSSEGALHYRETGRPIDEKSAMSLDRQAGRPNGVDAITLPYRGTVRIPPVPAHPMDGRKGVTCSGCHKAHSSQYSVLFVRPGDWLCRGCHSTSVISYTATSHGQMRCVRCHSVHEPEFSAVLRKENPGLCLDCHSEYGTGNVHPASPDFYDTNSKQPLTCTSSCHNPHGSTYSAMLRVPYLTAGYGSDFICLICHRQVGVTY